MLNPDNPYKIFLEPQSIKRAERIDNARDNAGETRKDGDWLVNLIERKLRGEA